MRQRVPRAAPVENDGPAYPLPVRDAGETYGPSTNTVEMQKEADRGTLECVRSVAMAEEVWRSAHSRQVEAVATLENPEPPPEA